MSEQGYEQLTLFQEGFLANPLAYPGSDEARKMTVSSGLKCSVLLKNSGPVGLLGKMLLGSSIWNSTTCFLTWKAKATKRGRLYFQLVPSTPRTDETGFLLWPTPTARDCKGANSVVHHKTHLTPENINDPEIALGEDNLELLCRDCHAVKHIAELPMDKAFMWDEDGNLIPRSERKM